MKDDHLRLFLPGPVEVHPDVREAQAKYVIGHRGDDFHQFYASFRPRLNALFGTEQRVYMAASSGAGMWEAATRNTVREGKYILQLNNGAFGKRWTGVSNDCGKLVDTFEIEWGKPLTPEAIAPALEKRAYDAVALVHNETSTGVLNPMSEVIPLIREKQPEAMILVDGVSALGGTPVKFDEWGIDVYTTAGQKALATPPGIALCAVSDRALARAEEVSGIGYYFNFLHWEVAYKKDETPATSPVTLMFALDAALEKIFEEGIEERYARIESLAVKTREWMLAHGFGLFAPEDYLSPTVTCVHNINDVDVPGMIQYLRDRSLVISNGYTGIKNVTFRIGHMGHNTEADLDHLLATIAEFLETQN